ncbi:MAG: gliding motility lipoprotein GldD [Bacteroidales bacterium]
MNKILWQFFTAAMLVLALFACRQNDDHQPKPKGYFRIATPQKEYVRLDSNLAYSFEYPGYAKPSQDQVTKTQHNWMNLYFPDFKGTIHLTYKKVDNNIRQYIEDSHEFVHKHVPKANTIKTRKFKNDTANVYGLVYEIKGTGTATPIQFFLTDSTDNFIRGVLYFNVKPNNDSLAPVIDFVEKDINQLIESFRWEKQ